MGPRGCIERRPRRHENRRPNKDALVRGEFGAAVRHLRTSPLVSNEPRSRTAGPAGLFRQVHSMALGPELPFLAALFSFRPHRLARDVSSALSPILRAVQISV